MFEELADVLLGPWGLVLLLVVGVSNSRKGREVLHRTTKAAIRGGLCLADKSKEIARDIAVETKQIVHEAEVEHKAKQ